MIQEYRIETPGLEELRRSWRIVAAAMTGLCLGFSGLSLYAFGVFLDPLARSFARPLSSINVWFALLNAGYIVAVPLTGRLSDRFGVRPVVITAIPLFALALGAVAAIHGGLWKFFCLAFIAGIVGSGVATITYARAVNSWFRHARGTALGLASAGVGISAIFGPRLMQVIVDAYGWRVGFVAMSTTTLAALPVMLAWLYEPNRARHAPANSSSAVGHTLAEALRSSIFWMLGIAYVLFGWAQGAVLNLVPVLQEGGIGRAQAASYAGLVGVFSLVGRVLTGAVIDRMHAAIFCVGIGVAQAFALGSFGSEPSRHIALNVAILGFAQGAEVAGFVYCTARFFGMRAYGAIYGLLAVLWAIGGGSGPYLFSLLHEMARSYAMPFGVTAAISAAAAALFALLARHPFVKDPDTPANATASLIARD